MQVWGSSLQGPAPAQWGQRHLRAPSIRRMQVALLGWLALTQDPLVRGQPLAQVLPGMAIRVAAAAAAVGLRLGVRAQRGRARTGREPPAEAAGERTRCTPLPVGLATGTSLAHGNALELRCAEVRARVCCCACDTLLCQG